MTDTQYKKLREFLAEELKKPVTREEALQNFIDAGIMDKDGNFTEPYKNLAKITKPIDPNLPY